MNLSIFTTVFLSAALCLSASTLSIARDLAIVLSPEQVSEAAQGEAKKVLQFLTKLEPGDRAVFINAEGPAILGEFVIPEKKAYASERARLSYNGKAVKTVMDFAKTAQSSSSGIDKAIALPDVLPFIGNNLAQGQTWDVLILGTPLYHNDIETSFSMLTGHFPSDGHLSASAGSSVFSIKGHEERLSGLRVHIAHADQGFRGPRHLNYVQRFSTLYVEQQSGQMVSFIGDLATTLNNVKQGIRAPAHDYQLEPSDKLEMILLRPVELEGAQSIYQRPVSEDPANRQDAIRAEQVEVAISWSCDCDLDLYAKAFPSAQTLYFSHTESPQGQFWKDHMDSTTETKGYETISFSVPLDLRALSLGVNFYSGTALLGVSGEIRLSFNGKTYAKPFRINAFTGDNVDMEDVLEKRHSTVSRAIYIDPLEIAGLTR